jgi:hypothetical protein
MARAPLRPLPYVPVPLSPAFCGLPPPLSLIETSAVRLPLTAGLKVTLVKQLPPAATLLPRVLVWAKSLGSVPVIEIAEMLTATLPLFVIVIVFGRLLVPGRLPLVANLANSGHGVIWNTTP